MFWKKAYKIILISLLIVSCAELPIKNKMNQLNCEPAESDGCAGWIPKE
jgi:hypothetical protein|tara:strand:+ start:453 stop:599 length:147 start_codon:yes stop_codon:yes gene_type:complete